MSDTAPSEAWRTHPSRVLAPDRYWAILDALDALAVVVTTSPATMGDDWAEVIKHALDTADAETNRAACGRHQPWGRT